MSPCSLPSNFTVLQEQLQLVLELPPGNLFANAPVGFADACLPVNFQVTQDQFAQAMPLDALERRLALKFQRFSSPAWDKTR